MRIDLTEANEIAKRIVIARDVRQEALKAAWTARHSLVVSRSSEEARRFPAARFNVVEVATGEAIRTEPMPIGFAKHVLAYHDYAGLGLFVIQPANDQGAALLAWRAA